MKKTYTDISQVPLILGAKDLGDVLQISRSNAYALLHSQGFPTTKIGKRLVVYKKNLIEWLEKHTEC